MYPIFVAFNKTRWQVKQRRNHISKITKSICSINGRKTHAKFSSCLLVHCIVISKMNFFFFSLLDPSRHSSHEKFCVCFSFYLSANDTKTCLAIVVLFYVLLTIFLFFLLLLSFSICAKHYVE